MCILRCVRKSVTQSGEGIIPLCTALMRLHLGCAQFCTHPEMSENCSESSGGTTNKVRGVKYMAYEETLRKMILFSLEKRKLRQDLISWPPPKGGAELQKQSQTSLRHAQ